jgi:hypothetical protein
MIAVLKQFNNYNIIEDYAFTVVNYKGTNYWGFNEFVLEDLLRPEGITQESLTAPIATPGLGFRKIIEVNSFPVIWNPKKALENFKQTNCSSLFKYL